VTARELGLGLIVSSGNDAAVAAAAYVSGSLASFVREMNQEMERLGFPGLRFHDASGLSARSSISAREFARFCSYYINRHPAALSTFHSVEEFEFPKELNLPPGDPVWENGFRQRNRNILLGELPGADGLKTGYIDESGYNIAATAIRGGTRFITVILGIDAASHTLGSKKRAQAAADLLEYGFQNYKTMRPKLPPLPVVKVWKGRESRVELAFKGEAVFTVPLQGPGGSTCSYALKYPPKIMAPIQVGDPLGVLTFSWKGEEVASYPLVAAKKIEQAAFPKRVWHSIVLTFQSLL